ncbi:MAG: fumarylacetoacetate hydrolase family protein [Pseudobdellovibrionaceae bacterium]
MMKAQNIWCVGRNYAEHAKELGNEVPKSPLVFLKAGSTAQTRKIILPFWAEDIHHEVELLLRLDDKLQISHAAVALDLTERQTQNEAKQTGKPWTMAKSFRGATIVSEFFPVENIQQLGALTLKLSVNGTVKQNGSTEQMIFKIPELLRYIQTYFPVVSGDWVLTGTPSGVGPLREGDTVHAEIVGKIAATWVVEKAKNP